MKQSNGWHRDVVYAVSALAISIAITACGNKDGGGGGAVAVVPGGVVATCATCPATMTKVVASATSRSINYAGVEQAELSLNFYGDTSTANSVNGYQGKVRADGFLRVHVAKPPPCNIPIGDYPITTSVAGDWNGQSFGNLQLQTLGPAVLRLDLPVGLIQGVTPAVPDWAGATFPFLMLTRVFVTPISTGGSCNDHGFPEYYFED